MIGNILPVASPQQLSVPNQHIYGYAPSFTTTTLTVVQFHNGILETLPPLAPVPDPRLSRLQAPAGFDVFSFSRANRFGNGTCSSGWSYSVCIMILILIHPDLVVDLHLYIIKKVQETPYSGSILLSRMKAFRSRQPRSVYSSFGPS
jgi:hypothetical protein